MKKIILLIFVILGITINSCKKKKAPEPAPNKDVTAEKTDVKTYEIIKLKAHGSLTDKYSATFGSATIELLKTSDSTLMFIVPEVLEGAATLEFELGKINFKVTKTQVANADQLVASLFQSFDAKVAAMSSTNPQEKADIDSLKLFKQKVLGLFNSLSAEEKMKNAMVYDANKDMFNSFLTVFSSTLNASTYFKTESQSDCLNLTGLRSRGMCTAENIAKTADALDDQLWKASFINKAGSKWLSGAYLVIAQVGPEIRELRTILTYFLNRKWILDDAIFKNMETKFTHDAFTKLNLNAELRSIDKAKDYYFLNVRNESILFFDRIESLHLSWSQFELLGSFPTYVDLKEAVGISYQDVEISNISNANVKSPPEGAGAVEPFFKFKSLSGIEESFSFHIKVTKEGFVEEKTMTGCTVVIDKDSTAIYTASAIGNYTVTGPPAVGNGPNSKVYCELQAGGNAKYTIYDDPSWPNGKSWDVGWKVTKVNNQYYILTAWTNPKYNQSEAQPLNYPVSNFVYRHAYTK